MAYFGKVDAISGAAPSTSKSVPGAFGTYNPNNIYAPDGSMLPGASDQTGLGRPAGFGAVDSAGLEAASGFASGSSGGYSGVDTTGMYKYYDPNGSSPVSSDFSLPEYPNAALASLYGMDQSTAYHEALANTAIQRRMMDYKAAGLNPVLAAHYNSGADSFSGSVAYPLSFGASQGSTPSGSSFGASYGGSSGKSVLGSFTLGKFMKNADYRSAIAALASAGTMVATKNFQLGAAAYFGVRGLLNSVYGYKK